MTLGLRRFVILALRAWLRGKSEDEAEGILSSLYDEGEPRRVTPDRVLHILNTGGEIAYG